MSLTINVPEEMQIYRKEILWKKSNFTMASHWCEITHTIFFTDISYRSRLKLTFDMNEHSVAWFDLVGRNELIIVIDRNEMITG